MVEIKDLNKKYGMQQVLYDVSLSFGPGEIIGLFGENGAGKTTLMKCVLGLCGYTGEVLRDGEKISRENIGRFAFATGEHSFFPDLNAKGHADFMADQFEVVLALSQGADYILMDEPFAGNDVFNREDFYKVLAGILEPNETVMLSTHLIEEVSSFIGRAVLIHKGRIIGDMQAEDLEDQGKSLMDYVRETYNYRADRVAQAIDSITG